MVFGQTKRPLPSRFIGEIDKENCDMIDKSQPSIPITYNSRRTVGRDYSRRSNSSVFSQHGYSQHAIRPAVKATGEKKVFAPGERIEHKMFGQGVVIKVTPMANDSLLEIDFDSVGKKKIMANFSQIKKI